MVLFNMLFYGFLVALCIVGAIVFVKEKRYGYLSLVLLVAIGFLLRFYDTFACTVYGYYVLVAVFAISAVESLIALNRILAQQAEDKKAKDAKHVAFMWGVAWFFIKIAYIYVVTTNDLMPTW